MKSTIPFLIVVVFLNLFISCKDDKDDNPQPPVNTGLPSVTTQSISNITATGAESGGNVTSDGGSTVTARGVCWNTSSGPTINNSKTSDGSGTGSFTSTVSGLSPNQTYFLRAYATNSKGTAYGNEVQFSNSASQICSGGPTTITDIDGNIYNTVEINGRCWMKENLNVSRYRNGDTIPQIQDNLLFASATTGAWCYYQNDPANGSIYGKLYNWNAVNDPRGLAPTGWHVPTDSVYIETVTILGGTPVAGGKMKDTGTTHWASPNGGATNESGFTGLPGGIRNHNGNFSSLTTNAYFWSATSVAIDAASSFNINSTDGYGYVGGHDKRHGFSVRCVRD